MFNGAIPGVYDAYLVPLIFQPYALDLARRVGGERAGRVLEIAAGTGVVTRALASLLPEDGRIVATDLNQAMLEHAASIGTRREVEWRTADAMDLPFEDGAFDAVVCQFGVMFFPDKAKAFAEARRVLKPGGVFLFNTWDRIEQNEFADTVASALASVFPKDPPGFLSGTPHSYFEAAEIRRDLMRGGFTAPPSMITVTERSRAKSFDAPAIAYCKGTPLRSEIEARDAAGLDDATAAAAAAIARRFGRGAVDGKIQAHVVCVER